MTDDKLTARLGYLTACVEAAQIAPEAFDLEVMLGDFGKMATALGVVLDLAAALTAPDRPPRSLYEGGYEDAERQLGKVFREHIARALLGEDGT